ncbi:MAG: RNA-directed DNA polymerase [Paludibacteraceae bacterium]
MVTKDEVLHAYICCIENKRNTSSAIQFELDEANNVMSLFQELNSQTYRPTTSIAFVVTRPKLREVFAANFRDRVVHHLFVNRTLPLFERKFIADTYNCRVGKGCLYGVKRVYGMLARNTSKWVLKCDIQSFFMSIDKKILLDKVIDLLKNDYKGDDLLFMLWLATVIITHRPELNCEKHGDISLWEKLPAGKSLFHTDGTKGMPIGNLTSQLFANYYLCDFDHFVKSFSDIEYGRYMDDFVVIGEHDKLLSMLPTMRIYLKKELHITLHPNKVYLQPVRHGVTFIGYRIYPTHIRPAKRIIHNTMQVAKTKHHTVEGFIQSANSLLGFMRHTRSLHIRQKFYTSIPESIKDKIYMDTEFRALHVRDEYNARKLTIKKLKEYEKTIH